MNIPINQFEQHINEIILKRGLAYYKQGAVTSVDELEPNIYFAEVEGSESYEVEIEINKGFIKNIDCTCPYDGGICKHAVAVLFTIQADELKLEDVQIQVSGKTKKNKILKEKTPREELNLILNQLSKDELIKSILEVAVKDKPLLYQLLSKYSYLNQEQTQSFYTNQVKNIIKSAQGRDDFIDYYSTRKLIKPMQELIKNAEQLAEQSSKQGAIYPCLAIIEEMAKAMENMDDSDGYAYSFIESSFEILHSIACGNNKDDNYSNEIFNICIEKIKNRTGSGFDVYNDLIRLAADAIANKEQIDILKPYLSSNADSKYDNEFLAQIEYDLIERFDGDKNAQEFLLKNLHHSKFRKEAIEKAIAKKEYTTAKTYAMQGISVDKEYAGLVNDWRRCLLKIAELENDKGTIVELAVFLFNNGNHHFEYYHKAKQYASNSEWQNIVTTILNKLNSEQYWKPYQIIAKIYFEEKQWNKLFATISERPNFDLIAEYETVINEHFHKQLITLYESSIRNYLEKNVDRKSYEITCKAIRRLKKLIPDNNINYLINEFRAQYKNRRALIELINKI